MLASANLWGERNEFMWSLPLYLEMMKMYIATNGVYFFTGNTPEEVVENASNSNADFDEMNPWKWDWYKATKCKMNVSFDPVAEKKPVAKVKP